jgi:hypothetical protein
MPRRLPPIARAFNLVADVSPHLPVQLDQLSVNGLQCVLPGEADQLRYFSETVFKRAVGGGDLPAHSDVLRAEKTRKIGGNTQAVERPEQRKKRDSATC